MSTRTSSPSSTSSAGEIVTTGGGGAGAAEDERGQRPSRAVDVVDDEHARPCRPAVSGVDELVLEASIATVAELHRVAIGAAGDTAERAHALTHRALGAGRRRR